MKFLLFFFIFVFFSGCNNSNSEREGSQTSSDSQSLSSSSANDSLTSSSSLSYSSSSSSSSLSPQEGEDVLFKYQWYLNNTGQSSGAKNGGTAGADLNFSPIQDVFTGKNVTISLIDTGIQVSHPDLIGQIDTNKSYRYIDGSQDPSPFMTQYRESPISVAHGTACAGIMVAKNNNVIGVSGIAPNAKIVGLNTFSRDSTDTFIDALSREHIDVSNNSWGNVAQYIENTSLYRDAMKERCENGRHKKGVVYVFAAGNDGDSSTEVNGTLYRSGNSNFFSAANAPFAIAVGAVDANDIYSSYSSWGSNILVCAFGGEFGVDQPAIVTTDITGSRVGLDSWVADVHFGTKFNVVGNENGDYTNRMNGTSAAAPMVSATAALLLEANPELGYRDIQYILATTARHIDADNIDWSKNGAGHFINYHYGFGVVDIAAAIMKAESFNGLGPLITQTYHKNENRAIPDNDSNGIVSTIDVNQSIILEHVDIQFTADDHTRSKDLTIVLFSPSGTASILALSNSDVMGIYNETYLGSRRYLDENSKGTWTLLVKDEKEGKTGTLKRWTLTLYGHKADDASSTIFYNHKRAVNSFAYALPHFNDTSKIARKRDTDIQRSQKISYDLLPQIIVRFKNKEEINKFIKRNNVSFSKTLNHNESIILFDVISQVQINKIILNESNNTNILDITQNKKTNYKFY